MEPITSLAYGVLAIATLCFLYILGTRDARKLENFFPGLPGPKPWPFIGNLPDLIKCKGQLHIYFEDHIKEYGRLFSLSFGGSPALCVTDPEMIKEILVKRFDCFHDRPQAFKLPEPMDKAMTIVPGQDWKRIRSAISPSFSTHKLKGMTSLMNVACDTLMKKIDGAVAKQQSIDVLGYQQAVTMDAIMSTAFGIQTDCQNNPEDPVLQTAIKTMKPSAFSSFIANIILPLFPYGRALLTTKLGKNLFFSDMFKLADIAKDVVNVRRKGHVRKDLLDLLLNATEQTEHKRLTDDEVVAQTVIFLAAGYETSSTTLSMTCYHLATNPDIQQRLQQEVDSVWNDKDDLPTYEMLHDMPYLDMVISETLRHCPPGFILIRECTKECTIKGLRIPKDSQMLIPVYNLQRDPEFFPDPERFDPERFNAANKESRDPYAYLAFGQGPHNCIGMRFALMEMKLVLMRLVKRYSFFVAPETKVPPVFEAKITLTIKDGMVLGVRSRNSQAE